MATSSVILQGLTEIIDAEGPMLALRAFQLCAKAAGSQRLGRTMRSRLNSALAQALRQNSIIAEREHDQPGHQGLILRRPETPPVVVRTLGPRSFSEIPPSEIGEVMRRIRTFRPAASRDELFRAVLEHYGLVRMTAQVATEMERILMKPEFGQAAEA